ncbi:glycine--tRNA ligase subunit beta [Caulobacter sp. Root1455]|uniref:glycine--tRNA ligase subunit beta n=1 Tax=unclassified Caulobacter TaxID=2648921 RepID=UPI0006FEC03C|nr:MULTISPECIES: glycine--tRNA ligase subunit beta [unclassified Caulobacter]KQY28232.1 glycine--tRNA ligase subunit beta [Caulobacter sp. Root487D2Y]KQY91869.1 glycine--tRNA ligase subunit beta [Caulobacter sp. Root1455]
MPQLLLELFSEEIPARMQAGAARDLERMAREHLAAAGFLPEALKTFAGPRRLTLVVEGLPIAQADRKEELKGPRVGAPPQAMEGFLRKAGLTQDQLVERDGVWMAFIEKTGRPTTEIVAEMVEAIVRGFAWPKSMTWGTSKLRWVRPLKRILCVFDREVVPFAIEGIESGDVTEGHRFMRLGHGWGGQPFKVRDFDEYSKGLLDHFVVLDVEERKARILEGCKTLCFARNLELVEDLGLLEEVAGLAEWPTPVLGDMDPAFLDLPGEVIRTSMRTHQKYFAVRKPDGEGLAPHFITIANVQSADGGKVIAQGNAKVLSSRLSDARFFWDEDVKVGFEPWLEKLNGVTFHAKLGTMAERVERIVALAREIAPLVGADPDKAAEAARLAKADLASQMVGEFPELQGLMGGYYARAAGMDPEIADAIRDHYKPQGPGDSVPTAPLSVAVALADKLDTLVGFFAIDEKPTGSKDPFALRRAALGVIRILLENNVRGGVTSDLLFPWHEWQITTEIEKLRAEMFAKFDDLEAAASLHEDIKAMARANRRDFSSVFKLLGDVEPEKVAVAAPASVSEAIESFLSRQSGVLWQASVWLSKSVLDFFVDRLKVTLKDQGKRSDLVDAVFALGDDDLVRIVARVEALDGFLKTDDGKNLLAGYKRASNILKAEEKKGWKAEGGREILPDASAPEVQLHDALRMIEKPLASALEAEDFTAAMQELAGLRGPVDAFLDGVFVNSEVAAERDNRLKTLAAVRDAMGQVADFSLVGG